ncbi:MAG: ABC transporter transmembrane domain-containing protein, partial [Jatrophihabitantaceae bacterium]
MSRGPFSGVGVTEKSLDFGPSARRLLGRLSPERVIVTVVLALSALSVTLSVIGPRLLGDATNVIFGGAIGQRLPAGQTKEQVVAATRASGNQHLADLFEKSQMTPGKGIDFHRLGSILAVVLALYVGASLCSWLQGYLLNGVVQRTVFRLRGDVEDKLNRLPLRYFDGQQRGEVLSRVTNDIDNISTSLQQTMSQLLT